MFDDRHLVQCWLDTEAALARAQAGLQIIPESAAVEITNYAKAELFDLDKLRQSTNLVGYRGEMFRLANGIRALSESPLSMSLVGHLALTTEEGGPLHPVTPAELDMSPQAPVSHLARAVAHTWRDIEISLHS